MGYKDKPILRLYEYKDGAFVQIAQIDDYQQISFEHNIYSAGAFTISINYNIPNAKLFRKGLFVQFGTDKHDFGEIYSISNSIGSDGKGSELLNITGYDARYIFKRRIIKELNSNDKWTMTNKGERCIRALIDSQCGESAEASRRLPVNNVYSLLDFNAKSLPITQPYWGGCYSAERGVYVLTGETGTILASRNGSDWTVAVQLGSGWFERCFYSNVHHAFFAVGNVTNTSSFIYKSTDGYNWEVAYTFSGFLYLTDICEDESGLLVAVGNNVTITSTNGTTWTNHTIAGKSFKGLFFAKNLFIGLLVTGIATSTDGVNWTQRLDSTQPAPFYFGCYSPYLDKFLAVGYGVYTSADGINWTAVSTGQTGVIYRFVMWDEIQRRFYACGDKGAIIVSKDGVNWDKMTSPVPSVSAINNTLTIIFSSPEKLYVCGGIWYLEQGMTALGGEYTVSEAFTNLYDTLCTIATQTGLAWAIAFDGESMTLEVYEGEDKSKLVYFSPDFESLSQGTYTDSADSYANTIYVGGKGTGSERDIFEASIEDDGEEPASLERFEAWDDQSSMTTNEEYEAEAYAMLSQYGQTVTVSGAGLVKCPFIFREDYDIGDIVTMRFSDKEAVVQILAVTEQWSHGNYTLAFSFGKPINTLDRQLNLILKKIESASNKTKSIESVKWYTVASTMTQDKADVTFDTLGFTGTLSGNGTYTLYLDNEGTGAKLYNIYVKNLTVSSYLRLTTGRSGATNYDLKSGTYVAQVYVDASGNVIERAISTINSVTAGSTQAVTSGAVANAKYGTVLDAKLTTAGWYKICEFGRRNRGFTLNLDLCRWWEYGQPESHKLQISYSYQKLSVNELASCVEQLIDKVKICYNSNDSDRMALYMHKSTSVSNQIYGNLSGCVKGDFVVYNFETDSLTWDNTIEYNLGANGLYQNGVLVPRASDITHSFPICTTHRITDSTSWDTYCFIGADFLSKFNAYPEISGKTKKARFVFLIFTDTSNTITIGLQLQGSQDIVEIISPKMVWGGTTPWSSGRIVGQTIQSQYLNTNTQIKYKSSGGNVAIGSFFIEVYYE